MCGVTRLARSDAQRRAALGCGRYVLRDEGLDGVGAEHAAPAGREQRIRRAARLFPQPGPEDGDAVGGERGGSLLASLAGAAHVGTGAEMHVIAAEPGQLRDPQPCLDGEREKRMVPPPGPGPKVLAREQEVDLVVGEEGHRRAVRARPRYGEHALDDRGVLGVAQPGEAKQRVDRREPRVAGPGAVAALLLEVIKERPDQRRVEL